MSKPIPTPRNIALMLESDGPGGAEVMLLHLAEGLRRRGHEICPVLPDSGEGWLASQFVRRDFVPEVFSVHRAFDPVGLWGMTRTLRRRRVDLVHSHEFVMATYGGAASRLLGLPHVITMHGSRRFAEPWRRGAAMRWAVRKARGTAAVSRELATFMEHRLRLPPGCVQVVPNGIEITQGDRTRTRESLGLTPEQILILAVGNLYPVKGHIVLLKSLAGLRLRRPDLEFTLAIAGRGEEEENLRVFADSHDLGQRLMLLGYRQDVPDLLAAADIYVMPSISEGLPIALLEAMGAGKAIAASRVGSIPLVLGEGSAGLLAEAGNENSLAEALERLLDRPALRSELGREASARMKVEFGLDRMVDAYERLYTGPSSLHSPRDAD